MDYGSLIREAWTITWQRRFLWLLGLFAASGFGTCNAPISYQVPAGRSVTAPTGMQPTPPEVAEAFTSVASWVSANIGLIVAVALFLFLLGLVFVVISLVAQGGMAQATADLARGRPSSLGGAWRAGWHYFWRYLGLWLLLLLAAIAIAVVVAIFVGLFFLVGGLSGESRVPLLVLGVLLAVITGLAAVALGILVSIVVAFAQRAIVVEDVGPLAALRSGVAMLRLNLGPSLLVWLVSVALGIGAGIAVAMAAGILFVFLGIIGAIVWAIAGFTAPTIVYAALGLLVFFLALWGLAAVFNTYFWSYWTIAYLRLTGQAQPALEA